MVGMKGRGREGSGSPEKARVVAVRKGRAPPTEPWPLVEGSPPKADLPLPSVYTSHRQ